MIGWLLFWYFLISTFVEEGALAAAVAVVGAVSVDVGVALLFGGSVIGMLSGAGLADDVMFWALRNELNYLEKVALTELTSQAHHLEHEAREHYDHTDYQNEQYSRYLASKFPGQTFLYGDVTPVDLIDFGLSAGYLIKKRTFTTLLDAAKNKYGGLIGLTSEVIEIGGA